MTKTLLRISSAALLLLIPACSAEPAGPVTAANKPKDPEPAKDIALLTEPKEDVFTTTHKAADFEDLKVTTLKEGEGEATLDFGEIGMFHLVGKLASGKEFKNTKKGGSPEQIIMMEWGHVQGLVLGVVGMKVGEIRNLFIPASLAYGERGYPSDMVPKNASMWMRAELTAIEPGLDSGFKVRRMQAGKGDPIRIGERGSFHYTGVLGEGDRQGERFDTSRLPGGSPFAMVVGVSGAIEGWLKGAIGMRVGEKRWLRIPAKMAYGDRGQGSIPPGATLVFEMELVKIDESSGASGMPPGMRNPADALGGIR